MNTAVDALRLVLASSSPRRRRLLAEAGYVFDAIDPPVAEPADLPRGLSPAAEAEALAYFKARSVADRLDGAWVLGADTVVSVRGQVLGKPDGRAEAERMLRTLSGSRHAVITGVALVGPAGQRRITSDCTFVTMRPMTEEEIADYLASGEWAGKAGAYAIQETADRFVRKIEGSFSNVVGLPVELVGRLVGGVMGAADGEAT